MRSLPRLLIFILAALWFWLADSLLLTFTGGIPYLSALFSGATAGRLLIRLLITAVLLFYGIMGYFGAVVRHRETVRVNKADSGALFGREDSGERSQRLLFYSLRLATALNMRQRDKDDLRVLCYCYDLGMVGVPRQVMEKGDGLSNHEQSSLDNHVNLGAEIAYAIPQLRRASHLIACHEERYNGGGPRAMYGRSIPLACRIFSTVVMYDYYTNIHDGGRVMDNAEALDELGFLSGTMLDPDVVEAFRKLMSDDRLRRQVMEHVYSAQ